MQFNRSHPSPRYAELLRQYRELHECGETMLGIPAEQTFPGLSLVPQAERIKQLVVRTGARALLDYGSGKGLQYRMSPYVDAQGCHWQDVLDYWGVDAVACYDPCYEAYDRLPDQEFDGVICTDVLEHCPEQDLPWILAEIFGYARRFVFANVACYPASKHLPNGENCHCTVRDALWWRETVASAAARRPGVTWEFWVETRIAQDAAVQVFEQRIAG